MEMDYSDQKAVIRGKVFDKTGKPWGGVKIYCNELKTLTLFDGSYSFKGLPQGTYEVAVSLEGYNKNSKKVTVLEGEEAALDLSLEPATGGGRIWGHVTSETTGRPPATGGTVFIRRQTSNRAAPINPLNGLYEFTALPPGTYILWTAVLEHEDKTTTIELADGDEVKEDITISKRAEEVPWG
jgi:hypothetical protein